MYRKLRIKIVLSAIIVLLLLFAGTIAIVYITSFRETLRTEQEMLSRYAEAYWENGNPEDMEDQPPIVPPPGDVSLNIAPQVNGQFYSAEWDETGALVSVHNPATGSLTEKELIALAERISATGSADGHDGIWVYHLERRNGRVLVTLMDNTLVSNSSATLMRNTIRYGGLMMLILWLVIWFTSDLFVRPLEKNEREQQRFLSDAGHELKTPVSVIATNAELLKREIGENRWLGNIIVENSRSSELIGNLLTLTRTLEESPPQTLLNLSELTEGVMLPFEGSAFEKGHMLESDIQKDIFVRGNPQQLSSLVSILLDNAIQYGTRGSEVRISLTEGNHKAVLRVMNQCAPMTDEQCRQLFERFYRADPSRTESSHYGLGLSIAQRIVQSHHGSISADWKAGNIIFTAVFPLKKD